MKSTFRLNPMARAVAIAMVFSMAGCNSMYPPRDTSTLDNINVQLKQATAPREKAEKASALPENISSTLLPPPRPAMPKVSAKQLEQRFDLVVNDAPMNQVLMGIVEGTPYSIMVKPKTPLSGPPSRAKGDKPYWESGVDDTLAAVRVTVNLKNVTLFEALDSIREVYGYDYTLEGNRIYVQPPELQTRLYQVDYVIGQRRGVSDMQVIGGATIGSSSTGGTSTGTSSGGTSTPTGNFSSVQATGLSTVAKSDIWGEVEDILRTSLGCQIPREVPGKQSPQTPPASGSSSQQQQQGTTGGGASRADVTFANDQQTDSRLRGVDGCTDGRALSVSQMSGTIMVRGMPSEHRLIEKMLRSLQLNIQRQVIIEAKIIDVTLNADSQQGINWQNFNHGMHRASLGSNASTIGNNPLLQSAAGRTGGLIGSAVETTIDAAASTFTADYQGASLASSLGTAMMGSGNAFAAGLGIALQFRNFAAMINFLKTQGEVHVLSSPRISTLNSQKAVIKVGSEEPYVASITPATNTTAGQNILQTTATLNYQPFFSGISLDVTPKVDDKDNITLHVHAMVNSVSQKEKIAAPDANSVLVPFAINTVNETDSVVKARDGQVVVIGGLMTERMEDSRGKTPGAGDVPGLGAFFSKGGQRSVKRELVILLRSTVVRDDTAWADDITATQTRIESLGASFKQPAAGSQ